MSFAKAQELLRLALMASARHGGVTLEEIAAEFAISHRTAQRMTDALETLFLTEVHDGSDRKRRWKLVDQRLARLSARPEPAVEALELAIRNARAEGRDSHAAALALMRDDLLARLQPKEARRAEAEAEALLQSLGHVARPGPHAEIPSGLLEPLTEALRGPFRLSVLYRDDTAPRILEPHGILLGHRAYLVARQPSRSTQLINFRLDRIREATTLPDSFAMEEGFSIQAHAARAFGVWQSPDQHGEVVWRFVPEAADHAAGFRFHPTQKLEWQQDGSLIVRFWASGWLEMAWHLYQWGDKVEVLAPQGLRDYVHPWRRSDLDGLP